MAHSIFLYLQSKSEVQWAAFSAEQQVVQSGCASCLDEIPFAAFGAYLLYVFVPATKVLLRERSLPAHNRSKWLAAIAYQFEDELIEPIEHYHFATRVNEDKATLTVAIASHADMLEWQSRLDECPQSVEGVFSVAELVPSATETDQLYLMETEAWLRLRDQAVLSMPLAQLDNTLSALLPPDRDPAAPWLVVASEPLWSSLPEFWHQTPSVQYESCHQAWLYLLAEKGWQSAVTNLLQKQYKNRSQARDSRRKWYRNGILFGAAILLLFATQFITLVYWKHQLSAAEQQIAETYRQVFPQASTVVAPRARMERALQRSSQENKAEAFLFQVAEIGLVLQSSPSVQVQRLLYRENGEVDLTVTADGFKNLEQFEQALKQTGLTVEQTSARAENNLVEAQYMIRERP